MDKLKGIDLYTVSDINPRTAGSGAKAAPLVFLERQRMPKPPLLIATSPCAQFDESLTGNQNDGQ